ncbi:hypothetical protein ACB094_08G010600 [Castanea mollissima]
MKKKKKLTYSVHLSHPLQLLYQPPQSTAPTSHHCNPLPPPTVTSPNNPTTTHTPLPPNETIHYHHQTLPTNSQNNSQPPPQPKASIIHNLHHNPQPPKPIKYTIQPTITANHKPTTADRKKEMKDLVVFDFGVVNGFAKHCRQRPWLLQAFWVRSGGEEVQSMDLTA